LDADTLEMVQELQFKSDYALPRNNHNNYHSNAA
jgi:hypothetical protein